MQGQRHVAGLTRRQARSVAGVPALPAERTKGSVAPLWAALAGTLGAVIK